MNWNQYFKLKQRQKRCFLVFFVALLFINVFCIRDFIMNPSSVCSKINITCSDNENSTSGMNETVKEGEISYDFAENNTFGINNTENALNKNALNNNTENTLNKTAAFQESAYMGYLWFSCDFGCDKLPVLAQIKIGAYRLFYTPLLVLTSLVLAMMLSWPVYSFSAFMIEHKKAKKEKPKQEPKEEKKKE